MSYTSDFAHQFEAVLEGAQKDLGELIAQLLKEDEAPFKTSWVVEKCDVIKDAAEFLKNIYRNKHGDLQ
jgi:hypothetical protein